MAEIWCERELVKIGNTELLFCYPAVVDSDEEREKEKQKEKAKKQAIRQVRVNQIFRI